MAQNVQIDDLADAIAKGLQEYSDGVMQEVKTAVDSVANECRSDLEADSPKKSGRYAKGWKVTVTKNTALAKRVVIHNKEYRLTHLLENGHAIRSGGRSCAYPHIKKNEEKANAEFEKRVQEALDNGGC